VLGVPVQVVSPAFRYFPNAQRDSQRREKGGSLGNACELKSCLSRSQAAFATVAFGATSYDVLPIFTTPLGCRDDVIERKLRSGKPPSTILTTMLVAKVDVGAGKRYMMKPLRNPDTIAEPQH
jgi:hypothetical protein